MVAVIAAVGRQIEGNAEALLPRRQIAAIKSVRILGGRKARILPDRQGSARVHRRTHAAGEGREAGQAGIDRHVLGRVERSEEHTSDLKSLMRISYALFCFKTK